MTALHRIVLVALALLLAGCAGPAGAPDAPSTTPADAPIPGDQAEDRALDAEHDYVFAEKVPEDATGSGVGGVASPRAAAVAETNTGHFVRVRYGFWYETNTSDGTLHADGVSRAVYFVTPSDTTRVSDSGHEMQGSGVPTTEARLAVHVVNAANDSRDVSLAVEGTDTTHYAAETTVPGRTATQSPRLGIAGDEVTVVATVAGTTHRLRLALPAPGEPTRVSVFVAPDGTVVVTETGRPL
jgi:hypothetical protein